MHLFIKSIGSRLVKKTDPGGKPTPLKGLDSFPSVGSGLKSHAYAVSCIASRKS